jgi:single-stranded DNA-binding protein
MTPHTSRALAASSSAMPRALDSRISDLIAAWGELAERLHADGALEKGAEVHVEGRVRLNTWAGQDGQQRAGLSMNAWRVELLGVAGRRRRPGRPALVERSAGELVDLGDVPPRQRIVAAAAEGAERAAARAGRRLPVGAQPDQQHPAARGRSSSFKMMGSLPTGRRSSGSRRKYITRKE